MTLSAIFRVGGIPCLISDFLVTGNGPVEISVPTYLNVEKVLPIGAAKITGLVRKSALISPGLVVAGSGNGSSAQRAIQRLFANFEGKKITRPELQDVLAHMDDLAKSNLACKLIGWLVDDEKPVSFRWDSGVFKHLTFGEDFVEGSGKALYEEVAPKPALQSVSATEPFEGAAEFCVHQTATLWANELLRGNTLSSRFGVGYDIFIFDAGRFRLVEDVTYLLFKLEFRQAVNGGVTYRVWTPPILTKQFHIEEHCLIRVFLPPNMMGITPSESERMGTVPPLVKSSTPVTPRTATQFRDMPLTSSRYGCCWFGETEGGLPEVFTAVASRSDAAQFKIYVAGKHEDGLDEIKFELPPLIMTNMVTAAVRAFERGGTRLKITAQN